MASDDEWEDGEILEEGEEVEDVPYVPPPPPNAQDEPMTLAGDAQPPPLPQTTTPPSDPLLHHHASNGSAASVIQPPLPPSSGVLPRPPQPPPLPPGGSSSSILGAPSLPSASNDLYPRKRLHSTMQDQQYHTTAGYAPHRSSAHSARGPYVQSYNSAPSGFTASLPPPQSAPPGPPVRREFETYSPDLIVKYPRQVVTSNVLLDFAHWMEHSRARLRLNVDDIQQLMLNVLSRDRESSSSTRLSPFLLDALCPYKPLPTRVCVVLLGNVHPSVLQRYRSTLSFFDACSSVPCVLSKSDDTKRVETPLPELLYKFPRPPVSTKGMAVDELFFGHELTFLMRHSFGYTDELIILPTGAFLRKSQPLGGTWELDGDLLHLKWRQAVKSTAKSAATDDTAAADATGDTDAATASDEADAFTLDVLVSEDATMHYFNTDPLVDKTYARVTPEHLGANRRRDDGTTRSIRLGLIKAVAMDVARHPDGSVIVPRRAGGVKQQTSAVEDGGTEQNASPEATSASNDSAESADASNKNGSKGGKGEDASQFGIEYYVLSESELIQHGFPVAVEDEQKLLDLATNGCTRDRFVQTQPRPSSSASSDDETVSQDASSPMYALDCEMCETDIGMELTRVTVVDRNGAVVYDQLVKPQSTIINYLTEFSGITPEMLQSETCILADVQQALLSRFLFTDTVLVGHSLTSDLRALRIVHLKIADSAILYPHQRGFPFRTSLKYLTKTYLRKDIQLEAQTGHDSAEDASSAMALVQLKLAHGPSFGIPATEFPVSAFDSFAHKLDAHDQRMALFRLACPSGGATNVAATQSKPWQLYASGDLSARARSPYVHARTFASTKGKDASPVSRVDEPVDWAALKQCVAASLGSCDGSSSGEDKTNDDLCWIEIDGPSDHAVTSDFLFRHDAWMAAQQTHCKALNAFLEDLYTTVLPPRTLLLTVPQSDLTMLRYLKALRTRAKWRDAAPNAHWTDDMQAAVTDAYRGAMDSCVFLTQK